MIVPIQFFISIASDEIYSVTTQTIHPDEIEHEEEVDDHVTNSVCINDATAMDAQEEEVEESSFQVPLADDSDSEDKEYLGKDKK